jgi:DUF1365 family protein
MMYLDLEELPTLFDHFWFWSTDKPNLAFFDRRKHYGDPDIPLDQCIRDLVREKTGFIPDGRICLLTHLRYFGYGFNPVSIYYCYDKNNETVEYIVAEVNNTPWGEQHCYVLDQSVQTAGLGAKHYKFEKQFHVSPFMEMQVNYEWLFSVPSKRLVVHMKNLKGKEQWFDATLRMESRPIRSTSLARVLVQYPLMTFKVISAIYYQALKLWIKKIPFHTHPDKKEASSSTSDS